MKSCCLVILILISLSSCKTSKTQKSTPASRPADSTTGTLPVKTDTALAITETKVRAKPIVYPGRTDAFLEDLLKSEPVNFNNILSNRDSLKVQIIYTRIDRQADNNPVFKSYFFNVNDENYFYPASTVKLPVALMALERLNELKVPGLTSLSSMITENSFTGQTPVYNDPTTPDGRPTVAQYLKKIFLTSDNDAFNRLYELLGQQYINGRLRAMGYNKAQLLHRLGISLTDDENRRSNPVKFYNEFGKLLYLQPMQVSELSFPKRNDSVGSGYFAGEQFIARAMDFSFKNRLGLEDLTSMLKSVLFPASVTARQRLNLKPGDYFFLYQYMSQYPGESMHPSYDSSAFHDAYVKFLLYGGEKGERSKNIRIFNKSGNAYGFLTDVAYIVDFDRNIEFMLSATIYCNADGILNDDKYDYETTGLPFMKALGKLVYDYELKRERIHLPDLSRFKLAYDQQAEK